MWSNACSDAFQEAQKKLITTPVLVHFDLQIPLIMAGDVSAYGLGAGISHQMPDGTVRPIAFASRTLSPAERNYWHS